MHSLHAGTKHERDGRGLHHLGGGCLRGSPVFLRNGCAADAYRTVLYVGDLHLDFVYKFLYAFVEDEGSQYEAADLLHIQRGVKLSRVQGRREAGGVQACVPGHCPCHPWVYNDHL